MGKRDVFLLFTVRSSPLIPEREPEEKLGMYEGTVCIPGAENGERVKGQRSRSFGSTHTHRHTPSQRSHRVSHRAGCALSPA